MRVLAALDRHREDLVVSQQLDRAFGAASRVRDEDHRVAALAAATDLFYPILDPPREFNRRLTGDVQSRFVFGKREGFERGRTLEPRRRRLPVDQQRVGRGCSLALLDGFRVAALNLLPDLLAVRLDFVRLRHKDQRPAVREIFEERGRPIELLVIGGQLLERYDLRAIELNV